MGPQGSHQLWELPFGINHQLRILQLSSPLHWALQCGIVFVEALDVGNLVSRALGESQRLGLRCSAIAQLLVKKERAGQSSVLVYRE